MAEVTFSARALRDMARIHRYVADHGASRYADRMIQRFYRALDAVAVFPMGGRVVPEIGRQDIRETIVGDYRIIYLTRRDQCDVITIFHGARRFPFGAMRTRKE
ncbi:MAG TPA: type II toxin-antitoxin system RelE/ParE family toxin [Flavobacteriales bacterium]|nr:type II toxin-antitoxin system RelE/ParE family toxin [Flavobacteriales bacterium]